jgi:hypothetical protein
MGGGQLNHYLLKQVDFPTTENLTQVILAQNSPLLLRPFLGPLAIGFSLQFEEFLQ